MNALMLSLQLDSRPKVCKPSWGGGGGGVGASFGMGIMPLDNVHACHATNQQEAALLAVANGRDLSRSEGYMTNHGPYWQAVLQRQEQVSMFIAAACWFFCLCSQPHGDHSWSVMQGNYFSAPSLRQRIASKCIPFWLRVGRLSSSTASTRYP